MPTRCTVWAHKLVLPFFLLASMAFLNACGSDLIDLQPIKNPVVKNTGGTPVWLTLADPECGPEASVSSLSKQASVYFWKQPQGGRLRVDLSAFAGASLRSPAIAGATIDATHLIKKNFVDERPSLDGGRPLYLCRADASYPRSSLENVALAAAYGVQVGYQAYQSMRQKLHAPRLAPVHLLILPRTIEEKHVGGRILRKTLTDNAAWFKSSDDPAFYIAVIPHSRERNQEGNFWEQPAVLVHEYGHHVYYHLAPRVHRASTVVSPSSPSPSLDNQRVMHALEEAFADLYAYYAFQAQPQSLFSGRLHISAARDIEHAILLTGSHGLAIHKTLDATFLNHYLSPPALENGASVPSTVLQDEHSLGAVLAYGLNLFYHATATRADLVGGQREGVAKLGYLLQWAQHLNRRGEALRNWDPESSASLLAELLLIAIEASQSPEPGEEILPLSANQCQALAQAFPVYFDEWVYTNRLGECAAWR